MGAALNVHEGPQSISTRYWITTPLQVPGRGVPSEAFSPLAAPLPLLFAQFRLTARSPALAMNLQAA